MLLFSKVTPKQNIAVRRNESERTQLQCAKLFNHVWLFVILWILALQILLSVVFSRQEYWSGLSFLTQLQRYSLTGTCVLCCAQLMRCVWLCDTRDCSPPSSFVHGILQAGTLEWVAMPSSRGSSRPKGLNLSLLHLLHLGSHKKEGAFIWEVCLRLCKGSLTLATNRQPCH